MTVGRGVATALVGSLLCVACQAAPPTVASEGGKPSAKTVKVPASQAARVRLTGLVKIPATVQPGPGVSLLSERSAGLVSGNVAGLASPRTLSESSQSLARRLQQAGSFPSGDISGVRVRGARVYLADAGGRALPAIDAVQTDENGDFSLKDVPPGFTFMVVAEVPTADQKVVYVRTLVRVGPLGASAEVDPASTLVTVSVVDGLPNGDLGAFNPVKFEEARETVKQSLKSDQLPDFTDLLAVKRRIAALRQEIKALRVTLDEMRKDLADMKESLESLRQEIKQGAPSTPASSPQVSVPVEASKAIAVLEPQAPGVSAGGVIGQPAKPGFLPPQPPDCELQSVIFQGLDARVEALEFLPFDAPDLPDAKLLARITRTNGVLEGKAPMYCPARIRFVDARGVVLARIVRPLEPPKPGNAIVLSAPLPPPEFTSPGTVKPECPVVPLAIVTVKEPNLLVVELHRYSGEVFQPAPLGILRREPNGQFSGPVLMDCPVWLIYRSLDGQQIGVPFKWTFPSGSPFALPTLADATAATKPI